MRTIRLSIISFVNNLFRKLVVKIPTKSNIADISMKSLPVEAHWRRMSSLVVNIYSEETVANLA